MCNGITKNGTRCKREGYCWQHSTSRASQKTQTAELAPPRIDRRIDNAWFGGNFRGVVGTLVIGLIANFISLGVQLQFPTRIEVVNVVPEAGRATVALNQGPSCPASRPAETNIAASTEGSGVLAPPAYPVSLQDVVRASDSLPTPSIGVNGNDLAANKLPYDLSDLKGNVLAENQLSGAKTLQLPSWVLANGDTTSNPTSVGGPYFMAGPTGQVFDPSKVVATPSVDQMKALLDASGVGSLQTGITQTTSFHLPEYTGTLTDNSIPSGSQLSSPSINGSGIPAVLPTTWQTLPAVSGTTFPITVPTTLQTNLQ